MEIKISIILILSSIVIYFLFSIFHFLATPTNPKYKDCGPIVSKSNDEVTIRYGSRTKLYLNINFNKTGFRSIEVSPTTYFGNNVGQNVCFDLKENKSDFYKTNNMLGCILFVLIIIVIFLLIIGFWSEN